MFQHGIVKSPVVRIRLHGFLRTAERVPEVPKGDSLHRAGRPERRTEPGGIRDGNRLDVRLKHIDKNPPEPFRFRPPSGQADSAEIPAQPRGMQPERKRLRFQKRADLLSRSRRGVVSPDAGRQQKRRAFRFKAMILPFFSLPAIIRPFPLSAFLLYTFRAEIASIILSAGHTISADWQRNVKGTAMKQITSKELSLVGEQLELEENMIAQYRTYCGQVSDTALAQKFESLANMHKKHFETLYGTLK